MIREILILLFMRLIKNSNPNDCSYNRRINGLTRLKGEKINLRGELEMRTRLFQESRARDCQPHEELRRICCEETDRARRVRIDELSLQQERNPTTVSQLLTQIQDLQTKVNSLTNAGFFTILIQRAAFQPSNIPSTRNAQPRFWIAARYTEYYGYFGTPF